MTDLLTLLFPLLLATQAQPTETTKAADEPPESVEAAEVPPVEEVKKDRGDEIVCRRETVVGSKFKKKICATRAEWQSLAERGRDTTLEFQRRGKGVDPVN